MLSFDTDFEAGVVLPVDKPYGWTSSDVVRKLRVMLRRLGYRKIKVGHAGTLDPLATGLLLVCIGRATKQADTLQAEEKEYVARIELGATTPSYDLEHPVDERFPYEHITQENVEAALQKMTGEQDQLPPVYSAKQIEGKRAYEYAREGVEVELRTARVNIHEMCLLSFELPVIEVLVRCSKGTYIRSLARDIGLELGSGGHLVALRRTRSGSHLADEAYTLDQLETLFAPSRRDTPDF
ncbi:MAG: tRNA pseudouridine(55) synthase TruB [Rikenellaceae bacterium]|jgi:tRNA pseudouridine55 synthase|nr:tRNA pseudouridine(55) synthase TruB [Rikenellaceae bacterium]